MKRYIIAAIVAASFSANAARVCTEVIGPSGDVVQACKNVPDQAPAHKPAHKPAQQPVAAVETVVQYVESPSISKQAYSGIAQAASLQTLMPSDGKSTLNLSGATFGDQSAIGLTFAHRSGSLILSAGYSAGSSGNGLVRFGAGFEF